MRLVAGQFQTYTHFIEKGQTIAKGGATEGSSAKFLLSGAWHREEATQVNRRNQL